MKAKQSSSAGQLSATEVAQLLKGQLTWKDAHLLPVLHHLHRMAESDPTGVWGETEQELFGDPSRFIDQNANEGPGFFASLIDGPAVDLVSFCGLDLTDEAHDALVDDQNWHDLVWEAEGDLVETGEFAWDK